MPTIKQKDVTLINLPDYVKQVKDSGKKAVYWDANGFNTLMKVMDASSDHKLPEKEGFTFYGIKHFLKQRHDEPTKKMRDYVDNRIKGNNKEKSALKAGYSKTTAKSVKQGIEQRKTYEQLLHKYISKDKILKALGDDIDNKPSFRQAELGLAAKILGLLVDRTDITSGGEVIQGFNYQSPNKEAPESNKSKDKAKDE